ncbi:hypothetical protein TNCV_3477291 [Trichonephila clavipes]|nr:hypothetical protein TNCV_3477291 [Trichonephila clavipes]
MVYALPSLQWLLRTISAYSEPAGATFLAVECPFFNQHLFELLDVLRIISSSKARVRCGRALSSIKMKSVPMAPRNRRTWGRSTSSQKRFPVTDPL